jgi:uncharacterized protein
MANPFYNPAAKREARIVENMINPSEPFLPRRGVWKRRLRVGATALCGIYPLIVLVLMALEDRLVFRPCPATSSWNPPGKLAARDVYLRAVDGTAIHAWWCPCEGSRGAILFCRGQTGNLSHRAGIVGRIQRVLGLSVLIFDYPGSGHSEGTPSEAGCYGAADAAHDWLMHEQGIPAEEIVLLGKSLGGGIAVDLASRRPHRALVLCMTFTSMPDVAQRLIPLVPVRWVMHNHFDNLAKIGRCNGPVFITHGTEDWKIPHSHSERLFEAAAGPKRYFPMAGVSHGAPFFTDECLEELRAFLNKTGDRVSPVEK